jgi:large subunit ribosomal protein L3
MQNVLVHSVDTDRGLLLIKGAVPGPKGALVLIRSAAKAPPVAAGQSERRGSR